MTDSSSTTTIASGTTTTITGNVTGTGVIAGDSTGVGNLLFSGTSAQDIASGIEAGQSTSRLNKISTSNTSGITFNNDVYATTLDFTNTSSDATISVASGTTIDITGDISQSGGSNGIISGDSSGNGTLNLSGSSEQNIYSKIGTGTSDRLGTLIIDNSAGAVLNQDSYITTLTLTNGDITVAGDKTLDVTDAINLTGKTFNSAAGSSAFGKITSSGAITVTDTTNIVFDYSNNTTSLDLTGSTSYTILEGSSISTATNANCSDNSYLFDTSCSFNSTDITATISQNSNLNTSVLGANNYNLIVSALNNTNMSSGIASVTSQSQLSEEVKTLRPMTNGALVNASSAISDNTTNITTLHVKTINSNIAGFSTGNKKIASTGVWGQAFGGAADQGTRKGEKGYTSTIGGLIFGSDKLFRKNRKNIIIGGALAYSRSTIEGKSIANNDNSVDSYQLILYNNNSKNTGLGFYNDNLINLSLNQYSTRRDIKIGTFEKTAQADFYGVSYAAKTGIGYNLKLSDNFLLSPNVAVQYFNLSQDSYTETGAGDDGLNVNNKDFNNIVSQVGVDLASKFRFEEYKFIPKISLSWQRNLLNHEQESEISFIGGGDNLENNSISLQKNRFNLGLGINIADKYGQSFDIKYNLQAATRYSSHIGSIQYRKSF